MGCLGKGWRFQNGKVENPDPWLQLLLFNVSVRGSVYKFQKLTLSPFKWWFLNLKLSSPKPFQVLTTWSLSYFLNSSAQVVAVTSYAGFEFKEWLDILLMIAFTGSFQWRLHIKLGSRIQMTRNDPFNDPVNRL